MPVPLRPGRPSASRSVRTSLTVSAFVEMPLAMRSVNEPPGHDEPEVDDRANRIRDAETDPLTARPGRRSLMRCTIAGGRTRRSILAGTDTST